MKINDYLKLKKITKTKFAKTLGMSRVTINYYVRYPDKIPNYAILAIEYITAGEVNRSDWGKIIE